MTRRVAYHARGESIAPRTQFHVRAPRGALTLLVAVLAVIFALILSQDMASAHAALGTSDPVNGDVLPAAPGSVTVTYTEPLEQSYSRMSLYDSLGTEFTGTSLVFGDDGYTMILDVPASLPNGTYSVLWRTLSEADGHTAQNYFAFTIGSNADIVPVVIPGSATAGDGAPQWAKTASRWAALLGAMALIACWPVWSTVIRPALGPVRNDAVPIVRAMRRFVLGAAIAAILGSVYALGVQAWALPGGTFLDRVINTLGQTRYGHLWLARIGLVVGLGLVLAACGWWFMKRRQVEGVIAWTLAAAVALPFSLIAHASAQPSGRTVAVAADAAHLIASSIWAGGIAILAIVLIPGLRRLAPEARRGVLRRLLPRFSTMALICMAVIGLTGFYAGWLQVGNWTALTSTAYGRALIVKLGLLFVILALAGINLLVITRKLGAREREIDDGPVWTQRLRWTVTGELILVVILLAAVGQMTSLQPARDVVAEEAQQIAIDFDAASPSSTLLLAPGIAGINHFRLEVDGPTLPTDVEALIRLTIPDRDDLGTQEILLSRVADNAFEHHGSELSIAADWEVTAIVRAPGAAPVSAETTITIGTTAPDVDVPGDPWRFQTLGGLTALALMVVGFAGLIVGLRSQRAASRKESVGLGTAALLLGVILLFQARIDPILASAGGEDAIDPRDVAMVERGEEIYSQQCLACHGPELRGDGPESAGLEPPPADFSQPHTMVHSDEDLIYWVRNGKQGTAMPAFDDVLSDGDIRDVLSFIEARQDGMGDTSLAVDAASCTVAPTTLDQLSDLAGSGAAPARPDLSVMSDEEVDEATAAAILVTTREMLACTNAMDTMRRMSLFTDGYLAEVFAGGISTEFAREAGKTPVPRAGNEQISLVEFRDIAALEDGRIVATVVTLDAAGQDHDMSSMSSMSADESMAMTTMTTQLVFAQGEGRWLVDEIIEP
ncbi:MAG: CopD family protein [Chloroflexota bacterium]|nr:CopD family protein [Chloroflexota bacterium]